MLMVGTMLDLYTFSMIRGTESIAVGLTFFSEAISMLGVGAFWMYCTLAPVEKG